MPFYSIAKSTRNPWEYYVITTPDRKTADLFYRYLQERPIDINQHPKVSKLCRTSTQMWKLRMPSDSNLQHVVAELSNPWHKRFGDLVGSVIIEKHSTIEAKETAGVPVIPHIDTADSPVIVSGGEYLIRNKFDHSQYWGMSNVSERSTQRHVERPHATAFCIELANKYLKIKGEPLLIDSDEVFISARHDGVIYPIYYNQDGKLCTNVTPGSSGAFKFGHFQQGNYMAHDFHSGESVNIFYYPEYSGPAREAWELVL
ncbi:uncharacterized protein APUU_31380A [Aspergillus puulaauensis]|uniref:Uncharacterized protein n=1 Tax=Aspergillus puulaauensis TaxID=1220207 RepID=A0A7R8AN39_9EURO|nr:uncharacterized protein APUU_31380A [Aspergillus puulaauensis]BCS23155.1 hypothetical protein APUU_31380A [Aspergillus puulaauensis]